jgi:hypothetical protein
MVGLLISLLSISMVGLLISICLRGAAGVRYPRMDPFSAIEAGSVSLLAVRDLFRSGVLACVGFVKPKIFSAQDFPTADFSCLGLWSTH